MATDSIMKPGDAIFPQISKIIEEKQKESSFLVLKQRERLLKNSKLC
jgi:hypothetical protein